MDAEELRKRTKGFAHRCVKLALALPCNDLAGHVRGQLIRCSTSVPSNYRAACLAQSKASFVSKLSIVIEEVDETDFWLEFVVDEGLLSQGKVAALLDEARELTAIFVAARKTTKDRSADLAIGCLEQ